MKFLMNMVDKIVAGKTTQIEAQSRRVWLQNFGLVSASSAVMWACGSSDDDEADAAATTIDPKADAAIVKVALELEAEAISLYTAAAGLDIWDKDEGAVSKAVNGAVKAIAVEFAGHHTKHKGALMGQLDALIKLDSTIEAFKPKYDAATGYVTDAVTAGADLGTVKGVLRLAANKEAIACTTYLAQVTVFKTPDLVKFTGLHGGDEAAHFGVLRAALFAIYGDTALIASPAAVIPSELASGFSSAIKV